MLDHDVEHEPVELGFRQRIRAFELDGVLRGEHEERLFERVRAARMVTRCSCIASSSADCVLGGVRLISSASTMFAKIGPGREHHLAPAGRRVFLDDVGAGDVRRHQVRRELNAVELEVAAPAPAC